MGELEDRMEADLRRRNLRPNTQIAYLTTAKALAACHRRSPAFLGADDVRAFLVHFQNDRQLSASTLCVYLAALRFLFRVTPGRPEVTASFASPRVVQSLPRVLSGTEVSRLLQSIASLRYRALATTLYGAGVRVSEACGLQVGGGSPGLGGLVVSNLARVDAPGAAREIVQFNICRVDENAADDTIVRASTRLSTR